METAAKLKGARVNKNKLPVWATALIIISVLGLGMIGYSFLLKDRLEQRLETVVVLREIGRYTDLPNKDVGTVVVDLKASEDSLNLGDIVPTRIQLFRSKILEGLSIDYVYGEKKIVSGMPLMSSPKLSLLDGNVHHIAYSFKRGEKQQLYFDGELVAESAFDQATKTPTGFLVKRPGREVSENIGAGFEFYDRVMSPDEIKALIR